MDRGGGGGRLSPSNALEDELCLNADGGEGGIDRGSSSRTTVAMATYNPVIIAWVGGGASYPGGEEVYKVGCPGYL